MATKHTIKEQAKDKLLTAYNEAILRNITDCPHKDLIDYVIDGTHLTYKYVLFNALLSKATDENLNPLCLQKKSTLPGSFDARTICHKVIVPFEQTTLKKVLGGSNEPFLNKPARYTDLSKSNAVRRGKDQEMLYRLCDELPLINTSEVAYEDLLYLLHKLVQLRDANESLMVFSVPDSMNLPGKLLTFCRTTLIESYEGETLTLIIAGLYHLLYRAQNATVEVHPVNESGASSKEISDLDIYINDSLITSNELKDKEYAESDVRHAADKVLQAGGTRMLFIEGPRGHGSGDFKNQIIQEYSARNFMLTIIPCDLFITNIMSVIPNIDCHEFMRFILFSAHETKFKEETISYMDKLGQDILGLVRN